MIIMDGNRKRNFQINFRVDEKEYEYILKKVQLSGKRNMASYLRYKIDVCAIAKHIVEQKMDPVTQSAYINQLWNEGDENILRLLFTRQKYFYNQLNREILRITSPFLFEDDEDNVVYGKRQYENMKLSEIKAVDPEYEKLLREGNVTKLRKAVKKSGV